MTIKKKIEKKNETIPYTIKIVNKYIFRLFFWLNRKKKKKKVPKLLEFKYIFPLFFFYF